MDLDVGCFQIISHFETSSESSARYAANVCPETSQVSDEIFRESMEKEQYEDHVGHIPKSKKKSSIILYWLLIIFFCPF